jgi:putative two-component system response regulator
VTTIATFATSPTKVLVVDHDDVFRRCTARVLADHGYSCVEAASGAQARLVLDAEPDVGAVLCQLRMPGESGIELMRELTADFPALPFVMTADINDPARAAAAFDLGAAGYLTKPFETEELLFSLAAAFRRRDLESAERCHLRSPPASTSWLARKGGRRLPTSP